MIKTLNFILVCTSLVGLVGVYALKFHVEDTASAKSALERQIERQQASLSLLEAEWAYLNQPTHVAPIIARHNEVLMLQPTKPTQFAAIDSCRCGRWCSSTRRRSMCCSSRWNRASIPSNN